MIESTANDTSLNLTDATSFPVDVSIPPYYVEDEVYVWDIKSNVAVALTLNTHYTLSGLGETSGGTLTLLSRNYTGNSVLYVVSAPDQKQLYQAIANGKFSSDALNDALDQDKLKDQEQDRVTNRSLRGDDSEHLPWTALSIADRALKLVAFDATGQPYCPFTVAQITDAIGGVATSDTSAAPTGLGLAASGRRLTVTWTTAGAATWHIIQAYPTGLSATESVVYWVLGAAGSFTFITPKDATWVVNVYGADFGKYLSAPAAAGSQATAMPTAVISSVTGGANILTVTMTAQAGYRTVVQAYKEATARFREITLETGETSAVFENLDAGTYDVRAYHVHDDTGEQGAVTTDGTGYAVTNATTASIVSPAGTGGVESLAVTWTSAGAGVYVQIDLTNSTSGAKYTSGWLAPTTAAYTFYNLDAGTYTGTIKGITPGVSESAADAFTITGAVTAGAITAPTGPTITPGANTLRVQYTPAAGIKTLIQINTNGNEDYLTEWITEDNTEITFIHVPAGSYEVHMYNQSASTGATSAVADFTNTGAYYTVTGTAGGTPDYSSATPTTPSVTSITPSGDTITVVMVADATNWQTVELWKQSGTSPIKALPLAPTETSIIFDNIEDVGNYFIKAWARGPDGGVSSILTDNNTGAFYTLSAAATTVSQYARVYVQGGVTVQTTNATGGVFDKLVNWSGDGATLGSAVSDYVNDKLTLTQNGNYIIQFAIRASGTNANTLSVRAAKDIGGGAVTLAGTTSQYIPSTGDLYGWFIGQTIITITGGTSTDIYLEVASTANSDSFTLRDGYLAAESINP